MNKVRYVLLLSIVAVVAFVGGRSTSDPLTTRAGTRRILYYVDPMHPAYKSDKPGVAPDCGMKLEPVYADAAPNLGEAEVRLPVGTVKISAEQQQTIGIRTEDVSAHSADQQHLRLLGRVVPDENRVYRINSAVEGWIRRVENNTTGSIVGENERLASFYSPEFYSAQQAYFYSLGAIDRFRAAGLENPDQMRAAQTSLQTNSDTLRNLGMSDLQLAELAKTRQIVQDIWIAAPARGLVVARNISTGQRFEKGVELYKIADLSHIWALADVYGQDAAYIRPGMQARITLAGGMKPFHGTVSSVPPQFDAGTRTLKVRIEIDNPEFVLRPDMFVTVELPLHLPDGISVPRDAVLDSGTQQHVFVDLGNGYFAPRVVETGWREEDRVQITNGLAAGERVVVSGTFLVDSESRLKAAAAGIYGAASKDPVCGMDVDREKAKAAGRTAQHGDHLYYFCSDQCKRNFQQAPTGYLGRAPRQEPHPKAPITVVSETKVAVDPICTMKVEITSARKAGRTSSYRGTMYYFCSDKCKKQFDADPEKFLQHSSENVNTASVPGRRHD